MNGAEGVGAGTRMVASTEALAHRATSAGFSPQGRAGGEELVATALVRYSAPNVDDGRRTAGRVRAGSCV
jgi:hypothetical protein